ncbi:unnamed protein product [marine sediment metagenome]|uniref:DUF1643 domain-containing protein n=1 Tax=marine sediment metagenome TaxID=412755 RepID=X1SW79_9ZZZZ
MLFIGLNPSTANELQDDPTIRRLCGFAESWGYGGLYACNLFSLITPNPKDLLVDAGNHRANTPAIQMALGLVVLTVCGWGDGINSVEQGYSRAERVCELMNSPRCFGLTQKGNPRHPLYLSGDTKLVEFNHSRQNEGGSKCHS